MVKVKTVFCILCVGNSLFTSQHSLSWDTRLWPLLGEPLRLGGFPTVPAICPLVKLTSSHFNSLNAKYADEKQ